MQVIDHIEIRDKEAVIRGRNLKAKMVAWMHLWDKKSIEEVMEHYGLTAAEVHAALVFYHDNREKLDAEYAASVELLREVGLSSQDFLARIEARRSKSEE